MRITNITIGEIQYRLATNEERYARIQTLHEMTNVPYIKDNLTLCKKSLSFLTTQNNTSTLLIKI